MAIRSNTTKLRSTARWRHSLEVWAISRQFGLLEETLNEEKNADAKLTQIAESVMNLKAARHQTA
jgi:ferritin-like metal-binding protein YciE